MSDTKFVVQTLIFPTETKFDKFTECQYGLTESDIFAKTFASHIITYEPLHVSHDQIHRRS